MVTKLCYDVAPFTIKIYNGIKLWPIYSRFIEFMVVT